LRIGRGEVTRGITSSALYWPADEVGSQSPGQLRPGDLSLRYTSCHIPSICLGEVHRGLVLSCTPSLEVVADQVVWRIFWKVFRRSRGLPTRSDGPTDRSTGLLVGRTHLSGTVVSLVGGDPRVPMSHTLLLPRSSLVLVLVLVLALVVTPRPVLAIRP
jgi:hypothetical protein